MPGQSMVGKILKLLAGLLAAAVVALPVYLLISPPALLRVATNYSAKIVCSNVFIAGRDAQEVLKHDVQAPGHPLLKHVSVAVDQEAQQITARLFRFFAPAVSQHRDGLGCANIHDVKLSGNGPALLPDLKAEEWPRGNDVAAYLSPALTDILADQELSGAGHRATVVVQNGRIVGESYGAGFDASTPLLGWSMTKTVTAALIGTLIENGDMALSDDLTRTFPDWASDERRDVEIQDMLAMTSGLEWDEDYGDVSDVTKMLYLNNDMAGFAASRPLEFPIGEVFDYSSGTSTMLARAWQDVVGGDALFYPREALFAPLGMTSAIMETDALNTFVGSSYMYATARDWARFGQFLLQKGVWSGQALLPREYVDWMFEPVMASDGVYTKGHLWREGPGGEAPFEDAVWLSGHDGQSIGIFPSRDIVIVRLGLTPSRFGYSALPLAKAVFAALDQ